MRITYYVTDIFYYVTYYATYYVIAKNVPKSYLFSGLDSLTLKSTISAGAIANMGGVGNASFGEYNGLV